jgi:amphi-Trp domain-containing protein
MTKKNRPAGTTSTSTQFASSLPADEVAAHLESLAKALRSKLVLVQTNNEVLESKVGESLVLDLDVRSGAGGKRSSIRLKMSWDEPRTMPQLSITSP